MTPERLSCLAATLLLATSACYGPDAEGPVHDDGSLVWMTQHTLTLAHSLAGQLSATHTDSAGHPVGGRLYWTSRSSSVVSVEPDGSVLAIGVGTSWVVVSDALHADSALVTAYAQFASIFAGSDASCGLTTLGKALCWGWNAVGTLGTDTENDAATPQPVAGNPTFFRLEMSAGSACGLGDGVLCWGYNGVGQLGDGTIQTRRRPVATGSGSPLVTDRLQLGAGATACAFAAGSSVLCWGWNGWGQLLDGTFSNSRAPKALNTGFTVRQIATGGGHVCALDTAGTVWCWGRNDRGQLGDGGTTPRFEIGGVPGSPTATQVSAGMEHACARASAGQIWCWGDNRHAQLGVSGIDASTQPLLAAGGMAFDTIASTTWHTCGLIAGLAYCWGDNAFAQLGTGQSGGTFSTPQAVAGNLHFAQISAGVNHSCGIDTDGIAWCWGHNTYGGLGDGTRFDRAEPVRVAFQP